MHPSNNRNVSQFKIADCSGYPGHTARWTMDYPELEREFPRGTLVVCINPHMTSYSWGKIYTVTGYNGVLPALKLAGMDLDMDGGKFQRLDNFPRCPHNTHIVGGDCPECAQNKKEMVIDARVPYAFEKDPYYVQLIEESKKKNFETRARYILMNVEGNGNRPFADKNAARAYLKDISGVDTVITVPYVQDYIALEPEQKIPAQAIVAAITQNWESLLKIKSLAMNSRGTGHLETINGCVYGLKRSTASPRLNFTTTD